MKVRLKTLEQSTIKRIEKDCLLINNTDRDHSGILIETSSVNRVFLYKEEIQQIIKEYQSYIFNKEIKEIIAEGDKT